MGRDDTRVWEPDDRLRAATATVVPSPSMEVLCPLCSVADGREILSANAHAVAIWDAFPVSPGHALIVSRRHVADLFELSAEEQAALLGAAAGRQGRDRRPPRTGRLQRGCQRRRCRWTDRRPCSRARDSAVRRRRGRPERGSTIRHPGARQLSGTWPHPYCQGMNDATAGRCARTHRLLGLMDLCIEGTTRHGIAPTAVTTRQLAEKVTESFRHRTRFFWPG
jgi:hypothetical protein